MFNNYESEARNDFDAALAEAFRRELLSWFSRKSSTLISYEDIRKALPIKGQHWIGIQQVPLNQIVGSVSRYLDFDAAFSPRQTYTRGRWIHIDIARLKDVTLPPVELYKMGELYFVKDGNHRISVAHENHQAFIDAEVIEINVEFPITKDTDLEKMILDLEQGAFLDQTKINELRPDECIEFSIHGQYEKLLEHIDVHRWYLGEEQHREISYQEALLSWYDTVYLPLLEIIRQKAILKDFPQRTETDLYLWIIEHHWYMEQDEKETVSLEVAAEDYRKVYSEKPIHRFLNGLKDFFRPKKKSIEPASNEPLPAKPPSREPPDGSALPPA